MPFTNIYPTYAIPYDVYPIYTLHVNYRNILWFYFTLRPYITYLLSHTFPYLITYHTIVYTLLIFLDSCLTSYAILYT